MAKSNIHLKIGDIKGESIDSRHKDEIDVESWSWGASNSGSVTSGGAGGAGKVTFTDLTFVHSVDTSSPSLWRACATGEHIKDATLASAKKGKASKDFIIIKMSDVLITSVSVSQSDAGGSVPIEQVAVQFAKVDFEYKPQKADGSLDAGVHFKYDIKANKEG